MNLRRYARVLLGDRASGDALSPLGPSGIQALGARATGYRLLYDRLKQYAQDGSASAAYRIMPRDVVLLVILEEFSIDDVSYILHLANAQVFELYETAICETPKPHSKSVMLIEDEAILAMDLSHILTEAGFRIEAVARTRAEAVDLAKTANVELIITDIELADHSSGLDAVHEIMKVSGNKSILVATGYPAAVLSGSDSDPTYILTKPFREDQLRLIMEQASIG